MRPGALPALLAVSLMLGGCAVREADDPADAGIRSTDEGYAARDAEIIELGADGTARYRLNARTIQQDPRSGEVRMSDVSLRFRDERGGQWAMRGDTGSMPSDRSRVRVAGAVQLEGQVGREREPIEIRSESLEYDLRAERARTDDAVTIRMTGRELRAVGMDANLNARTLRLESKVNGRFP